MLKLRKRDRRPIEPFASVISFVARAMIALLVLGLIGAIFWGGTDVEGIGAKQICVQDNNIGVDTPAGDQAITHFVRPGVAASNNGMNLCANHPSTWQRTLNVFTQLPSSLVAFGAMLLLWWLVAGARRHGPFAAVNGTRLRLIGWWLIIGGLLSVNIQTEANNALVGTMVRSD
jgi:hypothetical protein